MTTTTGQKRPEHHLPAFVRFAVQFIRMNLSLAVSGETNTSKRAYKYWKSPCRTWCSHSTNASMTVLLVLTPADFVSDVLIAYLSHPRFFHFFFSSFTQSLCRISFFCYYTYLFNIKIWAFLPFVKHELERDFLYSRKYIFLFLRLIYNSY